MVFVINFYSDLKCFTISTPSFLDIPNLNVPEGCS
jgi:hypothetical protein